MMYSVFAMIFLFGVFTSCSGVRMVVLESVESLYAMKSFNGRVVRIDKKEKILPDTGNSWYVVDVVIEDDEGQTFLVKDFKSGKQLSKGYDSFLSADSLVFPHALYVMRESIYVD